jgi:hypothetical protein
MTVEPRKSAPMTIEEFSALAAAWGGDVSRWPAGRRAPALALVSGSPAAADLLADAALLDHAIASARPMVALARSDALVGRVATAVAAETTTTAARRRWRTWFMPATSLASAALIGVGLGLAQPVTPPMTGAEYLTTLLIDGAPASPWVR